MGAPVVNIFQRGLIFPLICLCSFLPPPKHISQIALPLANQNKCGSAPQRANLALWDQALSPGLCQFISYSWRQRRPLPPLAPQIWKQSIHRQVQSEHHHLHGMDAEGTMLAFSPPQLWSAWVVQLTAGHLCYTKAEAWMSGCASTASLDRRLREPKPPFFQAGAGGEARGAEQKCQGKELQAAGGPSSRTQQECWLQLSHLCKYCSPQKVSLLPRAQAAFMLLPSMGYVSWA